MGKQGRFQKADWWQHGRGDANRIEEEKGTVRQFEDELMQEALGLKPKKLLLQKKQLSPEEMQKLLQREKEETLQGEAEDGAGVSSGAGGSSGAGDGMAIKGLGFAAHRTIELERKKAALYGVEAELEGEGGSPTKAGSSGDSGAYHYVSAAGDSLGAGEGEGAIPSGNLAGDGDSAAAAGSSAASAEVGGAQSDRGGEQAGALEEEARLERELAGLPPKEAKRRRKEWKKQQKRIRKHEKKATKKVKKAEKKAAKKVKKAEKKAARKKQESSSSSSSSDSD